MQFKRPSGFAGTVFDVFYDTRSPWFYFINDFLAIVTLMSLGALILETVPQLAPYHPILWALEYTAILIFTVEYVARLYARKCNPRGYIFSLFGVIDLISIVPAYLGLSNLSYLKAARVLRILRLLRMVRVAKLAEIGAPGVETEARTHLYKLAVQIYFATLVSSVTLFGTLFYVVEGATSPYASSIPRGMIWAAKATMGGVAQPLPTTVWGDLLVIGTRFTGLLLFGLLISIVGTGVTRMLLGTERI